MDQDKDEPTEVGHVERFHQLAQFTKNFSVGKIEIRWFPVAVNVKNVCTGKIAIQFEKDFNPPLPPLISFNRSSMKQSTTIA